MNSHDSTNISSKIPPTCGNCKVLGRIKAISIDHEIAVVFIDGRCFAAVSIVEELGHCLFLKSIDGMHIKPSTVARKNDGVGLLYQM